MKDSAVRKHKYDFVCFRCGCIIGAGEKMVSLSVTLETPTGHDVVEILEASAISTLCLNCAAALLGQAVACDSSLIMPLPEEARAHREEREEVA